MVASGLVDQPWVNPLKLSMHLILALILYCYLLWVTLQMLQPKWESGNIIALKNFSIIITFLVFLQSFYGGLMAGNKAALFYPTFPKIGSEYIPGGLMKLEPLFLNFIENVGMLHVIHRALGFIIAILIFYFVWKSKSFYVTPLLRNSLIALPSLVVFQILLGILTLVNSLGKVPLTLGVMHQLVALLLLTMLVVINFQLSNRQILDEKNVSVNTEEIPVTQN
jgi:cytochrome c oxidase assembly protein subunit 15